MDNALTAFNGCNEDKNGIKKSVFFNQEEQLFNKRIWRVSDVAKFLDCSVGHIYNLCSDEKIPKVKKGKFLFFIPEVIYSWVLEGELQ